MTHRIASVSFREGRCECSCGAVVEDGSPLIDLSPTAFGRLAPLSRGVIRVTIDG